MSWKGLTRRGTLGGIIGAAVVPQMESNAIVTNAVAVDRVFVDVPIAIAEAATVQGQLFKLVDTDAALASVRRRQGNGSIELYAESAAAALPGLGDASTLAFRQDAPGAHMRSVLQELRDHTPHVRQFGAIGDGAADDTKAIQAAFDSGAPKIIFPRGTYRTGPLVLPDWMHIQGEGFQPGIGGASRSVELRFELQDGAGLTCGLNPLIQNIFFQNAGGRYNEDAKSLSGTNARAIELLKDATIEECAFSMWDECVRTGRETYYLKTSRLYFNRSNYGYRAVGGTPYNIQIDAPHSSLTKVFISGSSDQYPRNIKIMGGSIEGYESVAKHFMDLACFGTYFETGPPEANVIAIDPRVNEASVALFGCLAYMNATARFVNMAGLNHCSLTSHGNAFDGLGQAGGICLFLPESGSVSAGGDHFGRGHPRDCLYVDSIAGAARFGLRLPEVPANNQQSPYSAVEFLGPRGVVMMPISSEPTAKIPGLVVLADGISWNPLGRSSRHPYWVQWQGERWQPLGDLA